MAVFNVANGITLTWNGGTITGGGSLNIASGGILNLFGNHTDFLDGTTLNNAGTVTLTSGSSQLEIDNGAVIQNNSGGLFDLQSDNTRFRQRRHFLQQCRRHLCTNLPAPGHPSLPFR